jgi:phospholipase C
MSAEETAKMTPLFYKQKIEKKTKLFKTMNVGILSLNVCLFVGPPLRWNGASDRAKRIGTSVYSHVDPNDIDVICLQELAVHRSDVLQSLHHHPFSTPAMFSGLASRNIRLLPSGLCNVSRWPITRHNFHVFDGATYHLEALVAKGVLYTCHQVNGIHDIHIFNVHLQAWTNATATVIRQAQIEQICTFITSLDIPPSDPVLLAGDTNIDFYENQHLLLDMMKKLKMTMTMPASPQFSFDPMYNVLVGSDDPDEYKTIYGRDDGPGRQLVDGVAFHNNHLAPTSTTVEVIRNTVPPFVTSVDIMTKKELTIVSDHFPVLCTLTFPSSSSSPPSSSSLPQNQNKISSNVTCSTSIDKSVLIAEIFIGVVMFLLQIFLVWMLYKLVKIATVAARQ